MTAKPLIKGVRRIISVVKYLHVSLSDTKENSVIAPTLMKEH